MKRSVLTAVLACALSGCTSKEDIELKAASSLSAQTPIIINGESLQICLRDQRLTNLPNASLLNGIYSPKLTLQFSQRVYSPLGKEDINVAKQIRAYSVTYASQQLFGVRRTSWIVCYYGLKDGTLTYLVSLKPDERGSVYPGELYRAVVAAEQKLSAK